MIVHEHLHGVLIMEEKNTSNIIRIIISNKLFFLSDTITGPHAS